MARAAERRTAPCDRDKQRRRMSVSESKDRRLEEADELKLVHQFATQVQISPSTDLLPFNRKPDRDATQFLALKKYKRTAEGDPDIRPLPVLMKSMDYILDLLDEPYSQDFLGLYHSIWDRMRAIRMDLRMQQISNPEAVSMLEQMIRLHIIAMHELCGHGRGEGSPEGFDAHLNIEQMNKAFVELFQMYNEHRRKGISFFSERELRAYYALLKLDKHPGYKVEPAELLLDLARLSADIRRSPEIAFARDVAKACRSGNYVSFFRLAKKASYLQACLMHPHFWKMRTEALASLHSSFRSNQGMPLARLEDMLAMEGEDIKSFVEHHGFVVKSFEEMYIVKSGPFLRKQHPPSKWSPVVGLKRSHKMISDIYFSPFPNTAVGAKTEAQEWDKQTSKKAAGTNSSAQELEEPSDKVALANKGAQQLEDPTNRAAGINSGDQELEEPSNKAPGPNRGSQELEEPSNKAAGVERGGRESEELASSKSAGTKRKRGAQELEELALYIAARAKRRRRAPLLEVPASNKSTGAKRKREPQELDEVALNITARAKRKRGAPLLKVLASCKAAGDQELEEQAPVEEYLENTKLNRDKLRRIFRKWRQRAIELRLCREKKEAFYQEVLAATQEGKLMNQKASAAVRGGKMINREDMILLEIKKEAPQDRFSVLYDKCRKIQDYIDKILYIYF